MAKKWGSGIRIDAELHERARDAAVADKTTLTGFVEDAIRVAIHQLERRRGKKVPRRRRQLKSGRPEGAGETQ